MIAGTVEELALQDLHARLPLLPDTALAVLVFHPRTTAPDLTAYAYVTGLPRSIAATLWSLP